MDQIVLLEEEQRPQGTQQYGYQAHQAVQVRHQHRLGRLDGLCFPNQAAGVALLAHTGEPVEQFALHQVAAGEQLIPGRLADGVALPGKQGLVGGALAFHHLAVGQNLVPGPGHRQIAQHQFLHAAGFFPAFPQHPGRRRVEQLQPLQGALRPQFLHRADKRIGKHHAQEQHVPVGPHQHQAGRQGKIQHIE